MNLLPSRTMVTPGFAICLVLCLHAGFATQLYSVLRPRSCRFHHNAVKTVPRRYENIPKGYKAYLKFGEIFLYKDSFELQS